MCHFQSCNYWFNDGVTKRITSLAVQLNDSMLSVLSIYADGQKKQYTFGTVWFSSLSAWLMCCLGLIQCVCVCVCELTAT